ncbi:TLD-domain-containing protein [Zopfochytrium polystomum]|nr:TLD-domain-containing protein [Zopfochytrium polystomum]
MAARAPVRRVADDEKVAVEGLLLTQAIADQLRPHLPPLLREASRWRLIYSIDHHGISINTLYRKCEEEAAGQPVLLVVKDGRDGVFGAFASEAFKVQLGYHGNGSCFLWKATADASSSSPSSSPLVRVYPATGANDYLILSEAQCVALGGGSGRFGLWIDADIYNGHSGPCQTFDNERLSAEPEFEVVGLEVWAFEL